MLGEAGRLGGERPAEAAEALQQPGADLGVEVGEGVAEQDLHHLLVGPQLGRQQQEPPQPPRPRRRCRRPLAPAPDRGLLGEGARPGRLGVGTSRLEPGDDRVDGRRGDCPGPLARVPGAAARHQVLLDGEGVAGDDVGARRVEIVATGDAQPAQPDHRPFGIDGNWPLPARRGHGSRPSVLKLRWRFRPTMMWSWTATFTCRRASGELPGQLDVGPRRRWIAARMVVDHDDRRRRRAPARA